MARPEKAHRRRRPLFSNAVHPVCCVLMTILFVIIQASEAQNDQQTTTPKKREDEAIPVTSFSCKGRVPGYYADLETGCQVYHMCAAGGQKFSYRCPYQTLFQQRMMVCDHWFMVDCKNSHLYFAANERIGVKNQPFIQKDEKITRDFVADSFYPLKLETRAQAKAIEAPSSFNRFPASIEEPDKDLLPPLENNVDLTERADFGSDLEDSTLPSIINKELTPVPNFAPSNKPFFSPRTTGVTNSPFNQPSSRPTTVKSASSFQFSRSPPFFSTLQPQNQTAVRPMGLSSTTLSVIKSSFFGNFPQAVSRSTQSFIPSTTPKPLTTLLDNILSPSTINSLLRGPTKKNKEPKQLRVMLDTRRMFYIPENDENLESIPSEQEQQSINFNFPEPLSVDAKPMRFKEHPHHAVGDEECPPQCFPAFFKPGTCEPCVILR
ncbi:uncharacterized protein LOC132202360 isoform X2 [Neocloeon triangulifer]|uniref:uncharacterized protein LOC132202360 isoform X2 n=1 Tax=Neocloeon triangulifer TaxID=2078957 RepID=UPI00286EC451|nr:uncharacterized protein LOC132202360 isoform X2 [Neocloeon triangulifer]